MHAPHIVFWMSALVLAYTYVGYPLLIAVWAKIRRQPHHRAAIDPRVSILVVAHNEASRIRAKLENLLVLDYEADQLEIVVASDGSSDATVAVAEACRMAGLRVVAFDAHRGKPGVLNELIPQLRGEIVVLMDVRQCIAKSALRMLVDNFADPGVGAVSGELNLTGDESHDGRGDGVGFYWRYEKFIRMNESRVDSTIGVTGALYAIRRELFEAIPEDTILDDVLIPMQIVRKGYRVLFEPGALASEPLSASPAAEFRRKARTIAGNFQLFFRHAWLLNPFVNRLWLQAVSHKFFRLLCPAFLVLLLIVNLWLLEFTFYRIALLLQVLFYAAAAAAQLAPGAARKSLLLSVPHAFCLLNWSTVAGFFRFVGGRQQVTWGALKNPEPH